MFTWIDLCKKTSVTLRKLLISALILGNFDFAYFFSKIQTSIAWLGAVLARKQADGLVHKQVDLDKIMRRGHCTGEAILMRMLQHGNNIMGTNKEAGRNVIFSILAVINAGSPLYKRIGYLKGTEMI